MGADFGRIGVLVALVLLSMQMVAVEGDGVEDGGMAGVLTSDQWDGLRGAGWAARVGDGAAIWVSVDEQKLRIVRGEQVLLEVLCATSRRGVGSKMDSLKTPLGWHSVGQMFGRDAVWGQVFRSRQPTDEIWKPGGDTVEDLVLTRVIALTGEEPGRNKGGNVDSFERNIYIHGTNDEASVGTPSSHGCIRLRNDDVIAAFDLVAEGAMVLITSGNSSAGP